MDSLTQPIPNFNPDPDITVLNITPIEGRGSLRAFVNIRLGKLVISDCRIIKEPGKAPWVSMPVLSYRNEHGTALYKTLIQIVDSELKNLISRAVITAWEQKQEEDYGTTME